jgi:hypothetical protein
MSGLAGAAGRLRSGPAAYRGARYAGQLLDPPVRQPCVCGFDHRRPQVVIDVLELTDQLQPSLPEVSEFAGYLRALFFCRDDSSGRRSCDNFYTVSRARPTAAPASAGIGRRGRWLQQVTGHDSQRVVPWSLLILHS